MLSVLASGMDHLIDPAKLSHLRRCRERKQILCYAAVLALGLAIGLLL